MIRIQKLLAEWGIASRRAIEKLITEGKVLINGKEAELGCSVNELDLPEIKVCGKIVEKPVSDKREVYAFNKPKYVISSLKDEKGRKCVADFLPTEVRLYPIGRLDYDSSGLLLVTNYGELTNRLLHPSHKVDKEYIVIIDGEPLTVDEISRFESGIPLDDGMTSPCRLKRLKKDKCYSVIIHEGRNRQVRRMFDFFGRTVIDLKRVSFGPIKLENLKSGTTRKISKDEFNKLLKSAGLV